MDVDELWTNFLETIKTGISSLTYETWFKDTNLVTIRGNTAVVVVPMPFHKKHLKDNYKDIIEDKFKQLTGTSFDFEFLLKDEWEQQREKVIKNENYDIKREENSVKSEQKVKIFEETNLNNDYNFENFIVGNCCFIVNLYYYQSYKEE